ncbi:MAG TPA: hypothetical protein VGO57_02850 [Verrucomicrobiae bacterium]|jgi:hypothetical protein
MKPDFKFSFPKRKIPATLLGLAFDGNKLDGVVLRRANGALQTLQTFSVTLTLDPLTAAPELAGREIRNQLDAAGVRVRDCVVGVSLKWVLTAHTELPPLPDADAASLLQMEAERGFSSDIETLQVASSRTPLAADKKYVLFAGIPNTQIGALENVLAAAKLKPVSFTLGISALQSPGNAQGVLALVIGENNVGLQVTTGGGIAVLRALDGTVENENGRRSLRTEAVTRETRVTLGQLPGEVRDAVKHIRIFGPRELAQPLVDELELRFEPLGLKVEWAAAYAPNEFAATVPAGVSVSAVFSLTARTLTEPKPGLEFLPPKPSVIEQAINKYSSGRMGTLGMAAAAIVVIVLLLFLFQEYQLLRLRSQWHKLEAHVAELNAVEDNIRQFRPWYDSSFHILTILKQITQVFPEDGVVTAKTIEIHDGNKVTCSGTARDNSSLLLMQSKLQSISGVSGVHLSQVRGKTPIQFSMEFQYGNSGGANAN